MELKPEPNGCWTFTTGSCGSKNLKIIIALNKTVDISPQLEYYFFISSHTNLHSKIERGDEEEATEAYILVRRGDDDEVNKVI